MAPLARSVDADPAEATPVDRPAGQLGIDIEEVAQKLETEGVGIFAKSFDEVLDVLGERAGAFNAG